MEENNWTLLHISQYLIQLKINLQKLSWDKSEDEKFYVIAGGLIEVTSVQIIIYIFIYEFVMYFYEIVVYMNHEFYVYLLFRGTWIFIFSFILANKTFVGGILT